MIPVGDMAKEILRMIKQDLPHGWTYEDSKSDRMATLSWMIDEFWENEDD